jgi:hypothetical protein
MGWRFRRVFTAGLFRFGLSRAGMGWSIGVPGLRYGVSATGRRYISAGFPGLGLYWLKYLSTASTGAPAALPPAANATQATRTVPTSPPSVQTPWWKQGP